ncbi:MAG: NAD(+) diphosphatase [Oscillospiraceae bacterium]|nr:NAD(+) diphosphatase [Oscillospiraceae bacterium]
MLQDLTFGKLENEFHHKSPCAEDILICMEGDRAMICRHADDTLELPTVGQVNTALWEHWDEEPYRYLFRMQERDYYLWMGEPETCEGFGYENARALRQLQSKDVCFAVMTARHLYNWYRSNRFCGRCGTRTAHDTKERMLLCPHCGNMIYPKISPAVIVAITDGDRLLLSKYAGRSYTRYALIAGYTEIGETIEQTVEREVMEEVGLRVKNLRYYKSQPWGVDGNVLMGFFCDLDGDDTVHLDETELALAEWHQRDALPAHDDGISLTREMIRIFGEGKEPK